MNEKIEPFNLKLLNQIMPLSHTKPKKNSNSKHRINLVCCCCSFNLFEYILLLFIILSHTILLLLFQHFDYNILIFLCFILFRNTRVSFSFINFSIHLNFQFLLFSFLSFLFDTRTEQTMLYSIGACIFK